MSHQAHDHSHGRDGHDHDAPVNRLTLAAFGFLLIFAALEYPAGLAIHNPAIIADAGHNAADALGFVLVGALINWLINRSIRRQEHPSLRAVARKRQRSEKARKRAERVQHFVKCNLQLLVGSALNTATIVFVGVLMWHVIRSSKVPIDPLAAMILGAISFAINYSFGKRMETSPDATIRATGNHLITDGRLALIVILAVPFYVAYPSRVWFAGAAILIFAWTVIHIGGHMMSDVGRMHPRNECQDVKPAHHHPYTGRVH